VRISFLFLPRGAELENRNLGKDLVDGAEVEGRFRIIGNATLAVGHPIGALENGHAILRHHRNPRELASFGEAVE